MNNEDNRFPEVETTENRIEEKLPVEDVADQNVAVDIAANENVDDVKTTDESSSDESTVETLSTEDTVSKAAKKEKKMRVKKSGDKLDRKMSLVGVLRWKNKFIKLPVLTSLIKKIEEQENEASEISLPQKGFLRHFSGIRAKLLMGFALPVLLMAIFGTISYNRTSQAIVENYEVIASDALNAVRDYIFLGVDAVSNKSYELTDNKIMKNYYNKANSMTAEESAVAFDQVKNELMRKPLILLSMQCI